MISLANAVSVRRSWVALIVLSASVWVAGCGSTQTSSETAKRQASAGGDVADTAACESYAEALCEAAGPTSSTCEAVRMTTGLMPPDACHAGLSDLEYSRAQLAEGADTCARLADKLCADIGEAGETCAMIREQTRDFEAERCRLMIAHYDDVLAEVSRLEASRQPLTPAQHGTLLEGAAPGFGPADAPVVIVAFSDFECPYCAMAADVTQQIRERYADRVRFVFRQFPLPFHANARGAAIASLAADAQGKFWEYHDLIFQHQDKLDRASLEGYGEQVGLDMTTFRAALDDPDMVTRIEGDIKLAEDVAVGGTPTMFVNGERVQNPTDFAAVSKQIEAALSKPRG